MKWILSIKPPDFLWLSMVCFCTGMVGGNCDTDNFRAPQKRDWTTAIYPGVIFEDSGEDTGMNLNLASTGF